MNTLISEIVNKYEVHNIKDLKNTLREVIQEAFLYSFSKAGLFSKAAFYGGTAIRVFYGTNRFSEDLDFALLVPDNNFSFTSYIPLLTKELKSMGLDLDISEKEKNIETPIKSLYISANFKDLVFSIFDREVNTIIPNERITIKVDLDTSHPAGASYNIKYSLLPFSYSARVFDLPSLLSEKIGAILTREWANRVKGRDLYDFEYLLKKGTEINISLLKNELIMSNLIKEGDSFDIETVKSLLRDKFKAIDYKLVRDDVINFISDTSSLDLYEADYFLYLTSLLTISK